MKKVPPPCALGSFRIFGTPLVQSARVIEGEYRINVRGSKGGMEGGKKRGSERERTGRHAERHDARAVHDRSISVVIHLPYLAMWLTQKAALRAIEPESALKSGSRSPEIAAESCEAAVEPVRVCLVNVRCHALLVSGRPIHGGSRGDQRRCNHSVGHREDVSDTRSIPQEGARRRTVLPFAFV